MGIKQKTLKICPWCGTKHYFVNAAFCCKECRKLWKEKTGLSKYRPECKRCGKECNLEGAVFCSKDCSDQYFRDNNKKPKCLFCGKTCNRHTTKFCSRECDNAYRSKHNIKRGGPQKKLKEIKCLWCGKVFMPWCKDNKYCSLRCSGKYRFHVEKQTGFLDKMKETGFKKSPETRMKLAKAMARRNRTMNGPSFRGHGGIRKDIGHYVRSRWEANICRLLIYLNIKYEFEPDTFDLFYEKDAYCYTPDIKIANNSYIEVKGYETEKARRKRELMTKLHPEVKILTIDEDKYRTIANNFKDIIPNWERDREHGI